jgi:hypothetical protein
LRFAETSRVEVERTCFRRGEGGDVCLKGILSQTGGGDEGSFEKIFSTKLGRHQRGFDRREAFQTDTRRESHE